MELGFPPCALETLTTSVIKCPFINPKLLYYKLKCFPSLHVVIFQDGGEFTIASSKTPALQARKMTASNIVHYHLCCGFSYFPRQLCYFPNLYYILHAVLHKI